MAMIVMSIGELKEGIIGIILLSISSCHSDVIKIPYGRRYNGFKLSRESYSFIGIWERRACCNFPLFDKCCFSATLKKCDMLHAYMYRRQKWYAKKIPTLGVWVLSSRRYTFAGFKGGELNAAHATKRLGSIRLPSSKRRCAYDRLNSAWGALFDMESTACF